jgi:SulP family sulfate permease
MQPQAPAGSVGHRVPVLARDGLAGFVASIALIANVVSFAALMFPGPLAPGASWAIWSMLVGSGLVGLWVAWKTSLPPLASGVDSPTAAVLVLLAATTAHALQHGGATPEAAIPAVMWMFTLASALSGALLWGLGLARWSSYLRFVPYFVVAGFLAATGLLLIAGGIRLTTGLSLSGLWAPWGGAEAAKLLCAVAVWALLLAQKRWLRRPLAMPATLLAMIVGGSLLLHALGLDGPAQGWYLPSLGSLVAWQPLQAWQATPPPLDLVLRVLPEIVAVAIVALISLVSKISSLEVVRKTAGDLDVELRAHGAATLFAAPFGGMAANMQLGTSRLLESAGGATRLSGVACALVLLLTGLSGFDLPALIPLPVAAGLVFQLGSSFLVEALSRPLAQRDWLNLGLSLAIMTVCARYGYVTGVVGGVVAACFLFAVSYARIGAIRQHLSRAQFAGNVSRATEASLKLSRHGEAIQLYWLSGYVFFGSSEGVFERVRRDVRALPRHTVTEVILDFSLVSAADASMTVSMTKLRTFCQQQGARLLFAGLAPPLHAMLERDGFFRPPGPTAFADMNSALAWAEEAVLARVGGSIDTRADADDVFADWLQQQLGPQVRAADFLAYLQRRTVAPGQVLYRAGEPADEIDLVACGRLLVDVPGEGGRTLRVRHISTRTVVGEMGFFRRVARSATVSSEDASVLWTLTRPSFERMRAERPDLACAFHEFLLRTLSDRIALGEKMMLAIVR